MLINNNYRTNINPLQNSNSENAKFKPNSGLCSDVFEKNKVPFKGFLEDILDSVGEEFMGLTGDALVELAQYTILEKEVGDYINVISSNKIKRLLSTNGTRKIRDLNASMQPSVMYDLEFISELLEDSNITNLFSLSNFIRIYSQNPKTKQIYRNQGIEAVEIYGLLDNKTDLSSYGEILLYLYNEEEEKAEPNYDTLNTTANFLRKVGIQNIPDLDEKYAHLKPQFNNFESTSDKIDAINHIQETYDDKISKLQTILNKEMPEIKSNAGKVYSSANGIVDFFYDINDGKNLDGLTDIIEYVAKSDKIKKPNMKEIAHNWNDFADIEDKIEFFYFLKDNNISVNEFNALSLKSIFSDSNKLSFLTNKDYLSESISQIQGTNRQIGFEFYKNFKDIINALYDDETESLEDVKTFVTIADRFNLKNSNSVLDFYNKCTATNNKNLTSNQFKEFINLFKYSDSKTIVTDAKAQKVTVVQLLTREKEQFEAIEKDIEDFCLSDSSSFFAGQKPLEIYKKYRKSLLENPQNISTTLQNIVDYDLQNSEEYKQKIEQIKPFSKYFKNNTEMLKFFSKNEIKFDSTEEDKQYRENCIKIFSSLYDETKPEISKKRIQYFANSKFLPKSKTKLTEFLNKMPIAKVRKNVLDLIADKKIPSINALENFFKKYKGKNESGKEILLFLRKLPQNITFSACNNFLDILQQESNKLNIPLGINSKNINNLDITDDDISQSKLTKAQIIKFLNQINNTEECGNFISAMPKSNKPTKRRFTSYRIAQEIEHKLNSSTESYQNLSRILGLSNKQLGLSSDCSSYIYARAIEEKLPQKFIDFINSDEWLKYSDDKSKTPNLGLHARLRAIDRFALNDTDTIETLYSEETKIKLQNLFKTVYESPIVDIMETDETNRIIADFMHDSNVIEAVFTPKGEMITIVPKRKRA